MRRLLATLIAALGALCVAAALALLALALSSLEADTVDLGPIFGGDPRRVPTIGVGASIGAVGVIAFVIGLRARR